MKSNFWGLKEKVYGYCNFLFMLQAAKFNTWFQLIILKKTESWSNPSSKSNRPPDTGHYFMDYT